MYEYYFTFRSVTRAQLAQQQLWQHGLAGELVRIPRAIASQGCGHAVRVSPTNIYPASAILQTAGILYERVFAVDTDGMAKEVFL